MATAASDSTQKAPIDFWKDLCENPTLEKCLTGIKKLRELMQSFQLPRPATFNFDLVEKEMKQIQDSFGKNQVIDKKQLSNCKKVFDTVATTAFSYSPTDPFTTHGYDLVAAMTLLEMLS